MGFLRTGCVRIEPFRDGFTTEPFRAALPEGRSIALARLQARLPDHKSVTLVARDRNLAFSSIAHVAGREEPDNGLSDGELRIYAQGERIINCLLPVFRLNPQYANIRGDDTSSFGHIWFERRRELDVVSDSIVGLVQDISLYGRGAFFAGASELLRGNMRDMSHPLEETCNWLREAFRDREVPGHDKLVQHVLGLTQVLAMGRDPLPMEELSQDQVIEVAENAVELFDIQTVARALVVGGLDAVARRHGEEAERAAKYNQKLQGILDMSHAFASRTEELEQLADELFVVDPFSFLGATAFLIVGVEYLEAALAIKFHGMRSQRLKAARVAFRTAHNLLEALREEPSALRTVFMNFAQRQIRACV